jgi:hypothetical protein
MRDSLQEIESRLVWVQKNRFDADRGRTRDELREACDRALDILALLAQNGITLDEVEPGAGRNLGIQGQ